MACDTVGGVPLATAPAQGDKAKLQKDPVNRADAAGSHLELKVHLDRGDGRPPQEVHFLGDGATVTIGRAPECEVQITGSGVSGQHCKLIIRRKGRDPILHVQDCSRNGTGVRTCRAAASDRPFKELANGDEEVIQHRAQLILPLRSKESKQGDNRFIITVVTVLPDAYDPWQKTGRWIYEEKLGEGGLASVYRAHDMTGGLGQVAVKVSKFKDLPQASNQNRHVYALHREASWSLKRLHNVADQRFCAEGSALFARYLEDHTGFGPHAGEDFDEERQRFEASTFDWSKFCFSPPLAQEPYVVIELVDGRLLQAVIEGTPPLDATEKRRIVQKCTESLVYMSRFNAIHRDFRGCNIFLQGRGADCDLRVIDLGFMISAELQQVKNPNIAVRCAWQSTDPKKIRFDWAPPEVRVGKGAPNFVAPGHSFDVFSFGVLVLKLVRGRTWTQETLHADNPLEKLKELELEMKQLRLTLPLLRRMLDHHEPTKRPTPGELLEVVKGSMPWNKKRKVETAPSASSVPSLQEKLAEEMRLQAQLLVQQNAQIPLLSAPHPNAFLEVRSPDEEPPFIVNDGPEMLDEQHLNGSLPNGHPSMSSIGQAQQFFQQCNPHAQQELQQQLQFQNVQAQQNQLPHLAMGQQLPHQQLLHTQQDAMPQSMQPYADHQQKQQQQQQPPPPPPPPLPQPQASHVRDPVMQMPAPAEQHHQQPTSALTSPPLSQPLEGAGTATLTLQQEPDRSSRDTQQETNGENRSQKDDACERRVYDQPKDWKLENHIKKQHNQQSSDEIAREKEEWRFKEQQLLLRKSQMQSQPAAPPPSPPPRPPPLSVPESELPSWALSTPKPVTGPSLPPSRDRRQGPVAEPAELPFWARGESGGSDWWSSRPREHSGAPEPAQKLRRTQDWNAGGWSEVQQGLPERNHRQRSRSLRDPSHRKRRARELS